MTQLRLTRVQVAAGGLAIAVAICAIFFFLFIRPKQASIARMTKNAEEINQQVKADRPKYEKELAAAKVAAADARKKFDEIMKTRMPDVSFQDPLAAMFRLQSLPKEEGQLLSAWFNSTGAQVSGYSFPAFSTDLPDPSARTLPDLKWNLSVTVKDFPAFLDWLEKLPKAPRLLELEGINLPGMRPPGTPFTATVSVVLHEWVKRPQQPAVQTAQAAGSSGAAAGAQTTSGTAAPAASVGRGGGRRGGGRRGGGRRGGGRRG